MNHEKLDISVGVIACLALLAGGAVHAVNGGAPTSEFASPSGEWRLFNGTLDGERYSLLSQINTKNAGSLSEVCRVEVAHRGSLQNRFTALGADISPSQVPSYPIAYDAGKSLNAAAKAAHETGYGAHWAGQGAPLARALPAAEFVAVLAAELREFIVKS